MSVQEARLEELEKEITERQDERRALLQAISAMDVEDYTLLDRDGNEVAFSSLFGDKDELIVIHNMGRSCSYCTLWADGFNGVTEHFTDRAAFALTSPNEPEVMKEFAEGRNWRFPIYSISGSSFANDMGFTSQSESGKTMYWPGYSVFVKEEDGTMRRVAKDFFGPMDPYAGIWHMFANLPGGSDEWHPKFSYDNAATESVNG